MKLNLSKREKIAWIAGAAVLAALLTAVGILGAVRSGIAESLPDQTAAARWGEKTAQMSVFFPADAPYSVESVPYLARQIDGAMTEASLLAEGTARLWYHAYSTERAGQLTAERGSVNVTVTVCGGDYFYIHTPELLSGSTLTEGASGDGAVFLDERAAFALFGAADVAGSTVFLGGQPYVICGVTAVPENEWYGDVPRIWVLYSSPFGREVTAVTAWEAVLPEPIDGFAAGVAADLFAGYEDRTVTVENSARFGTAALWSLTQERETLGVRTSAITYPWWENAARVAEYRASVLLTAQGILAVPAAGILAAGMTAGIRRLRRR